jgi:hypothetical protein
MSECSVYIQQNSEIKTSSYMESVGTIHITRGNDMEAEIQESAGTTRSEDMDSGDPAGHKTLKQK